jgi:predicted neutral ceramidase superfamily lipid hydrolase
VIFANANGQLTACGQDDATKWGIVRMCLGLAQMAAATVAAVLLVETGISKSSLLAVVIACALTTVSVLLFGSRRPRPPGAGRGGER